MRHFIHSPFLKTLREDLLIHNEVSGGLGSGLLSVGPKSTWKKQDSVFHAPPPLHQHFSLFTPLLFSSYFFSFARIQETLGGRGEINLPYQVKMRWRNAPESVVSGYFFALFLV